MNQPPVDLQLLANFVHQVVNPLNGVIGTLDNLIEGTVPEHRREQRLRAVRAQLEHAVLLVRNLAYFSEMSAFINRPDTGERRQSRKTCVIPQIIIEALMYFQEEGLTNDIAIHLEDRATQYAVIGTPELLRQVFMNLVDNGVKYGERGSRIRIMPRPQKGSGALLVEVFGTGAGFENQEAEKLFEVGYRAKEARNRIASGTGLGLYICRRIMEDVFGGSITAEYSRKKRETLFRLTFPAYKIQGKK